MLLIWLVRWLTYHDVSGHLIFLIHSSWLVNLPPPPQRTTTTFKKIPPLPPNICWQKHFLMFFLKEAWNLSNASTIFGQIPQNYPISFASSSTASSNDPKWQSISVWASQESKPPMQTTNLPFPDSTLFSWKLWYCYTYRLFTWLLGDPQTKTIQNLHLATILHPGVGYSLVN